MIGFDGAIRFSETLTAGAEDTVTLVTEYSDRTFPVLSLVMLAAGIVLALAVTVAGFVFVRKYFKNWGQALVIGAGAYLLFGYVLYMAAQIGLSYIPPVRALADSGSPVFSLIVTLLSTVLECAGVFLGMLYLKKSSEKRNIPMNISMPLAFGLAYYSASYLSANMISYYFQYIMIGSIINGSGFDTAVASLVEAGNEQEAAIQSLLSILEENSWNFLWNALQYAALGLISTVGALTFYGCMTDKLEKKWYYFGFGALVVFGIPNALTALLELSVGWGLLLNMIIVAATGYLLYRKMGDIVKEELKRVFAYRREKIREEKAPKKMPKIKMPD